MLELYLYKWYRGISKLLRTKYKWTPQTIDGITVDRLVEIYEDISSEDKKSNDYDDIEEELSEYR